jgi:alkylation response protein AidB-like acyl-CoA dehydrogenase
MKRAGNAVLGNLHQHYADLGKRISTYKPTASFNKKGWDCLTRSGLWQLPIESQYGGIGLTWQAFAKAIEGLISSYHHLPFFRMLVSQAGAIYLMSKYGTDDQKQKYLPRLLQGEIACIAINESFDRFDVINIESQALPTINSQFLLTGHKLQIPQIAEISLFILAVQIPAITKTNFKPIAFFVAEKNSGEVTVRKTSDVVGDVIFTDLNLGGDHIVGNLRDGLSMLCHLLEFERSLYGVLTTSFVKPIIKKCEQQFQEHQNTINRCGSIFSRRIKKLDFIPKLSHAKEHTTR